MGMKMGEMSLMLIVEPRLLVREGLVRLVEHHSYRVTGAVGSVLDIVDATAIKAPRITILAAHSVAGATAEVSAIKRLWPDTKIILLAKEASAAYFDMLTSQIHACMPFDVSPDVFLGTLQRVKETGFRILFMESFGGAPTPAATNVAPQSEPDKPTVTRPDTNVSSTIYRLSDREQQILKDIARGHSNKLIARTYSLAESTVKVHMKSILRKTRLANRTQVAIWAMGNGYATDLKKAA
jgi:two-component system nitrate/nitrite response regulator NarL